MIQELQELLGAYTMPVLIAIPLVIIVIIAAFKRDDYRPPNDYRLPPPQPPRAHRASGLPSAPSGAPAAPGTPFSPTNLPPLPSVNMSSPMVMAPTPMAPPAPVAAPAGPPLILIADDSAVVRTKLKRVLEGAGFLVETVQDGVEALSQCEARPEIAVLITDLEMPLKDGFELIADLRGSLTTEDLPIIAITGHDDLHGRVSQIEGVFGIFKKPWNDRELLKRVESLTHLRAAAARRSRRAGDLRAG